MLLCLCVSMAVSQEQLSFNWLETHLLFVCPKDRVVGKCCGINGRMKQALIRLALSLLLVLVSLLLVTKLADCQDASWRDELSQLFVCSYNKQWRGNNPLGIVVPQRFFCEEKSDFRDSIGKQLLSLKNDIN